MKGRTLRAIVKILRGRGAARLKAPAPGSAQWHLNTQFAKGFRLADLPETRWPYEPHVFSVTSPTGVRGFVALEKSRRGAHITGIYSNAGGPLNLGMKGYRQVFRGIHSTFGGTPERITFKRTPNVFRRAFHKVRTARMGGREEVYLR